MARLDFDELNATIRYLMFSVFAAQPGVLGDDRAAAVDEAATFLKQQEDNGVVVRGLYDVAGMRADADFMIWTHAERVESLQATYSDFRRTTALGRAVEPVWSSVALHRPAEFNKSHIPAFLAGGEPGTGTSYPTTNGARCWPTTEWRHGGTRTSEPTLCPLSRSATTNGFSRSRRPNCIALST